MELETTPISQLCARNTRIEELEAVLRVYACNCDSGQLAYCQRFDKENCGWAAANALRTPQEREAHKKLEAENCEW